MNHVDLALLDGFRDLPETDQEELRRFVVLLERRRDQPDEPVTHAYAEVYGEVVFEGSEPLQKGDSERG